MIRQKTILLLILFASCNVPARHVAGSAIRDGLSVHYVHTGKAMLRYWDSENGKEPILLLQGFGAASEFHWYKQLGALKDYRVILPDLLYFGGSKPDSDEYSVAGQVTALKSLLNLLEIKSYSVCGFSYGGLVAAELAYSEPGKIKKMVLTDAPVKYLEEKDIAPLVKKFHAKSATDFLVPESPKMLKNLMSLGYTHSPRIPALFYKNFYEHNYTKNIPEQKQMVKSMESNRSLFESRQYHFSFPVLLIWGEQDPLVPVHVGKQLKEHMGSNARLAVIPGAAHLPNLEKPAEYNKILVEFLEEREPEITGR